MKESILKRAIAIKNRIDEFEKKLESLNDLTVLEDINSMVAYLLGGQNINACTDKLFQSCVKELIRKERNSCQYEIDKYRKELEAL